MAASAPHTIRINSTARRDGREYRDPAASAITPGELLEFEAAGDLQAHSTAGGNAEKMVAVEDPVQDIDTDWASGEETRYDVADRGEVYYMFLAVGQNVSKGDALESDGAGALQAFGTAASTNDTDDLVAYAREDKDNSGGGSRVRIKVRIA